MLFHLGTKEDGEGLLLAAAAASQGQGASLTLCGGLLWTCLPAPSTESGEA